MQKLPLKKANALAITSLVAFAIAAACLFVAPLLDGLVNGSGSALYDFVTATRSMLVNVLSFRGYREIITIAVAGLSIVLFIFWFIVLLVKKQPKHLIPWFIALIGGLGSILVAAFYLCAFGEGEVYLLDWLFQQLAANVYYGAVILSLSATALAAIVIIFTFALIIIEIIDLFRLKKADAVQSETEEVKEEAKEEAPTKEVQAQKSAPVYSASKVEKAVYQEVSPRASTLTDDDIRQLIHEECEIIYLRMLRNLLLEKSKEDKSMRDEDKRLNAREETDEEYYQRMISELAMFGGRRQPAPQPKPQPAPQPAPRPVVKPAPVARPVAPAPVAKPKIIRIPFETRLKTVDKTMKDHFNELKSDIMAYGVKSRVSNSGDTFRLHTVTYVKMTIAGKSLKLYLALDPKDYKDTTLPFSDASNKGIYKEIPLVFKVKSELSLRRAKQLIADAMAKGGLEQGPVEPHDWVKDIIAGK